MEEVFSSAMLMTPEFRKNDDRSERSKVTRIQFSLATENCCKVIVTID